MPNDISVKGSSFINRGSQLRFVTHLCGSVLIGAVLSIAVFYYWTYAECGITYYQTLLTLHGLRQNILPATIFTGLTVTIVITAAILAVTLFASHKIAGPIYRLERSLESIGSGDLTLKIRFRPHDAVSGIAEEINSLTHNLNEKISDISRNLKEIRKEAEEIRKKPHQPPAILIDKIRLAKKAVSDFKTE